jgi:hypothetical protein
VNKQSLTFPDRDLFWAAPGNIGGGFVFDFSERGTSERNNQKQIQLLFQRGAEASSSLKRNKWGALVYAGLELELGGAER